MEQARSGSRIWACAMAAFAVVAALGFGMPTQATADEGASSGFASTQLSTQATKTVEDDMSFYFDDMEYTGSAITPTYTAYGYNDDYDRIDVVAGRDYTIAYQNNTNVGKAKAIVTGKGNYSGTKTFEFEIEKRSLYGDAVVASAIPNVVYTGKAQTPEPVLSIGSYTLKKGTDYLLEGYYSNVDVGTAHIDYTGIGSFSGSKSVSFTIMPASINNVTFTFADQEYTGWAVEPTPVASFNGVGLGYGDYQISYSNNVSVGTAQATITGNGNFTGSRVMSFKIVPSKTSIGSTLNVTAKKKTLTVKYSKLKKKAQKISGSKAYKVKSHSGKLTYKKSSVSVKGKAAKKAAKKIKVNKTNGAITLPKKLPKGTYTLNVLVSQTSSGWTDSVTVALKIKVK